MTWRCSRNLKIGSIFYLLRFRVESWKKKKKKALQTVAHLLSAGPNLCNQISICSALSCLSITLQFSFSLPVFRGCCFFSLFLATALLEYLPCIISAPVLGPVHRTPTPTVSRYRSAFSTSARPTCCGPALSTSPRCFGVLVNLQAATDPRGPAEELQVDLFFPPLCPFSSSKPQNLSSQPSSAELPAG